MLVYHVQQTWLPGGFLGVDVFFVVSGFLITTLLLREVDRSHRLDLRAFWLRRARRLLPALAVVVVTSVLAAWLVERDLLVGIGRQTLGALTFSSNWLEIASGSSYFDQSAPILFQTFWSLAIEEQFYLLWPLAFALLLALTVRPRHRMLVALAGAVVSVVLMAVLFAPGSDPTRVYYGTDTHVFGLLIGVALAFAWTRGVPLLATIRRTSPLLADGRLASLLVHWAPPVAAAALILLMTRLHSDSSFAYRGGILLASLLAAVAVAGCTGAVTPYIRALELRPLVWVGERSYGIYLWHWPLLLIVGAAFAAEPGTGAWWWGTALAVLLTLGLAAASYRWIETPIRRDGFRVVARRVAWAVRRPGTRLVRVVAVASVIAVVGAGIAVATAPAASQAQLAVEAGQRALADQAAGPSTTDAPPAEGEAAPPQTGSVDGGQVVAFGDSVLSGAAPAVLARFPGIAIDAKPIRKWIDAVPIIQAAADAGKLRPVVVLNFGTNGGFQFKGSEDAVRQILDIIGPDRKIVLVNTVGISYWVSDANKELAAIAGEYPNTTVVDWNAAVRGKPGLLHPDRTHPNVEGTEVYADVLEQALLVQ